MAQGMEARRRTDGGRVGQEVVVLPLRDLAGEGLRADRVRPRRAGLVLEAREHVVQRIDGTERRRVDGGPLGGVEGEAAGGEEALGGLERVAERGRRPAVGARVREAARERADRRRHGHRDEDLGGEADDDVGEGHRLDGGLGGGVLGLNAQHRHVEGPVHGAGPQVLLRRPSSYK